MAESVLNNKRILAVDDEPDILEVLKEEIETAAPTCSRDCAVWFIDQSVCHPKHPGLLGGRQGH